METEHTVDLVQKLQQATTKINDQEEKIKTLHTKLLTAKQESDQLIDKKDKKENELKVNIPSITITGNIPIS